MASLDNPFPDQRLLIDGHLALAQRPRWFQPFLLAKAVTAKSAAYFNAMAVSAATDVRSLGHHGGTLLLGSEALDPDSLATHVVRVQQNDDGSWSVIEREVHVEHLRDVLAAHGQTAPEGAPNLVFIRPAVPVLENHKGALVVLKGPKTAAGVELGRGFAWRDSNDPLISAVAGVIGVAEDEVLLALPQDSGDVTTPLKSIAAWAKANPPEVIIPAHAVVADDNNGTRPVGVWTPADADWSTMTGWLTMYSFSRPATHVGAVVIGELRSRDLREAGVWKDEWVADPSLAPIVPIRFVMVVPKGTPPEGGWPMVIAQHGVGGRNSPRIGVNDAFCLGWAEAFNARGMGCIGIDATSHGSRGPFTAFFNVENLPVLRENFREMTFDLLQLEAAAPTIDLDGDGVSEVNPTLRYFGNSLGSIFGSSFVPLSNRTSTAALNVPGAGLGNLIVSENLQDLIGLLISAQTGISFDTPEYYAAFPLFRVAAQPFFDTGDPINIAHVLKREVNVLQQAGKGDQIIPNDTSIDLSHALGLSTTGDDRHVFTLFDPAQFLSPEKAAGYNGHNIMWDIKPIRDQTLTFLESDGTQTLRP